MLIYRPGTCTKRSKHKESLIQDLRISIKMKFSESFMLRSSAHRAHQISDRQCRGHGSAHWRCWGSWDGAKPSYITEWQYRDGNSTNSESTTSEFSRQKEIDPLTLSPTITGSSHDGRWMLQPAGDLGLKRLYVNVDELIAELNYSEVCMMIKYLLLVICNRSNRVVS